jgi:hypothetical protein
VSLTSQTPAPRFFVEPPARPDPLHGLWIGAVAAVLLVLGLIGGLFKQIAARWRGIVLTHIFFLTLWLAIQVFFFTTGAYWCLPNENSKLVDWFSKLFPQISRCGPTLSVHGALPSPGPLPVSSFASPKPSSTGLASASSPRPAADSSVASSAAASAGPPATSSFGSASGWSSRSVANCWRDRSVGGNCYGRTEAHRKLPPARFRYPAYPCRRSSDCGWDAI